MAGKRRRYLLNTNVPLSAFFEELARGEGVNVDPVTHRWLRVYGALSYYLGRLLRHEVARIRERLLGAKEYGGVGEALSYTRVKRILDAYNVARLGGVKIPTGTVARWRRLLRREYGVEVSAADVAYMLVAKSRGLVLVTYDTGVHQAASIIGVAVVKPWGVPRGPQDIGGSRRPGGHGGEARKAREKRRR